MRKFNFDDLSHKLPLSGLICPPLSSPELKLALSESLADRSLLLVIYGHPYININDAAMLQPPQFFKCLADETRLRCLMLLQGREELCVCELTQALQMSQPKISRHLALLRASGLLQDRRQGAWVYYRLHPALPAWARAVLASASEGLARQGALAEDAARLAEPAVCVGEARDADASL